MLLLVNIEGSEFAVAVEASTACCRPRTMRAPLRQC